MEENLNIKKEEQVSTVYSLNSKFELVPEEVIEIKDSKGVVKAKNSVIFYSVLMVINIIVFLLILFLAGGSDAGIDKAKDMVASSLIAQFIFSAIIIAFYKIL